MAKSLFFEATGDHFGKDVTRVMQQNPHKAEQHHVPWYAALNDGRYKYVRYLKPDVPEDLYDLISDPEKLTNLAESKHEQPALIRMRQMTVNELIRTEANYIDLLPSLQKEQ